MAKAEGMKRILSAIFELIAVMAAGLALSSAAGTAEEDEAARVQIGGTAVLPATVELLPGPGRGEPRLAAWHGCGAAFALKDGLNVLEMSALPDAKPWSGFSVTAPEGDDALKLESSRVFTEARLVFSIKEKGAATTRNLQVAVSGLGADGKRVGSRSLQLARVLAGDCQQWREVSIPLKDLGGADQLRAVDGVSFQFVGTPSKGGYLIAGLRLERKTSKSSGTVFDIEAVDLSQLHPTSEAFPASATNIRILGPNIVRDGKPVFLTGVEDSAIGYPWLYKLLGVDIIQLQDFHIGQQMRWSVEGDTAKVSWDPMKEWIETKVRLLLSQGFAIHVNYWDGAPKDDQFRERFADSLAETSHFYCFRLDDPVGRAMKENYTRATLRTLGKYPITFYELYNEVVYGDNSPAAIATFQLETRAKYGDIAAANRVWGTKFQSFEAVLPPRKKAPWSAFRAILEPQPVPVELYVEWQCFLERWLGKELRQLTANVKKDFKHSNSYVIYQAVMNLHQDYSGFTNTCPWELLQAEDALCHEGGMNFYPQAKGLENLQDIAKMTRPLMIWDLLKNISPDKPVYLSECTVAAYAPTYDPASALHVLDGAWRFADDSDGRGLALGFEKPGFDDSSWAELKVPGVWGGQGFPKCVKGWFRRSFRAPASSTGKVYLTGQELADRAQIYLNGKLLQETAVWNEGFSADVTDSLLPGDNTLAIAIANKCEVAGQVQGGIRGFVALTGRQFFQPTKLTAGQMRTWFWEMAVHDVSGVVMSYFYVPATNRGTEAIYSPLTRDYAAMAAIPEAKRQIGSVAETLLPRPRLKGEVALVYPFEDGRARVPENNTDLYTGKLTLAMMQYYLAALFSQIAPEVTTCEALLKGEADKFKVLILPCSTRVPGGVPTKLENFVAAGGTLILGPGTMAFDDDTHRPIVTPQWLGVKVGGPLKTAKELEGAMAVQRQTDGSYGVELTLDGAEPLAKFSEGSTAVTVNRHGKGVVYYFACDMPFPLLKKLLAGILSEHGLKPSLSVTPLDGSPAHYVEAHVIGAKDSFVWYLNNFGGGERKLKVAWLAAPQGVFTLRDVRTGRLLGERLDAKQLAVGVELTAPSQTPVALLLERAEAGAKAELSPLPAADQRFLDMWRRSPSGQTRLLFSSCANELVDPFKMLTGKKLLEDEGFELHYALDFPRNGAIKTFFDQRETEPLANYPVYALLGSRLGAEDHGAVKEIADYVRNGGSVLLSGTANLGYFAWLSNCKRKPLLEAFGLQYDDASIKDEREMLFSPLFCAFDNVDTGHPITAGVKRVQLAGTSILKPTLAGQRVLVRSNPGSVPPNAPFLVAMEFGKGRVVAMGDPQWLEPEWLDKADNARLMLNIFNWLARRDTAPRKERKP